MLKFFSKCIYNRTDMLSFITVAILWSSGHPWFAIASGIAGAFISSVLKDLYEKLS